jgi:hypothetical protein
MLSGEQSLPAQSGVKLSKGPHSPNLLCAVQEVKAGRDSLTEDLAIVDGYDAFFSLCQVISEPASLCHELCLISRSSS